MILSSISVTQLLLQNNLIFLHQSLNFVLSLSNHPGSETILLGNSVCLFCSYASVIDILSVYSVLACEASLVIFQNPSYSDNTSISCSWCWYILLFIDYTTSIIYLLMIKTSIILVAWPLYTLLLQGEPSNALPNVTTLDLAQVIT